MNESVAVKAEIPDLVKLAGAIVASYVATNPLAVAQIPELIQTVFGSLSRLGAEDRNTKTDVRGLAVSVKKSVTPDFIVCLEDGKKMKMLKRHLRTTYNMSPDEYRAKWRLPRDYPMVAPNYAARRSEFAKEIGLGRKTGPRVASARRGKRAKGK